eukprot:5933145-Prymnesium_polylepis.1
MGRATAGSAIAKLPRYSNATSSEVSDDAAAPRRNDENGAMRLPSKMPVHNAHATPVTSVTREAGSVGCGAGWLAANVRGASLCCASSAVAISSSAAAFAPSCADIEGGVRRSASACDPATPATPTTRAASATSARGGEASCSPKTAVPHTKDDTMPVAQRSEHRVIGVNGCESDSRGSSPGSVPMPHQMPGPAAAPSRWMAGQAKSCVAVRTAAPSAPFVWNCGDRSGSRTSECSRNVPTVAAGCFAGSELPPNVTTAPSAAATPWAWPRRLSVTASERTAQSHTNVTARVTRRAVASWVSGVGISDSTIHVYSGREMISQKHFIGGPGGARTRSDADDFTP